MRSMNKDFPCRAAEWSLLDLHLMGHWSSQLLVIDYLLSLKARLSAGWQFPNSDANFVTGYNTAYASRGFQNLSQAPVQTAVLSLLQVIVSGLLECSVL